MNFPQFWARGSSGGFTTWRWSFKDLAEAQALANQAAQQLADRFRVGDRPRKQWGYYPNRPFREQILREIRNDAGEISAVVTRNSYGSQILNTARVMFVDIDLPEPKPSGNFFQRLFGKAPAPAPAQGESEALTKIENWTRSNPAWGWRVYRTRSGLRLIATQQLVEADSQIARDVFEELGADPLYRKLCETQKCFRARLTPKPWRCGLRSKSPRWPWLSPKHEQAFQRWEARYQSCCVNYATCELLRQIGNARMNSQVETILQLHDSATRVGSKLPLA